MVHYTAPDHMVKLSNSDYAHSPYLFSVMQTKTWLVVAKYPGVASKEEARIYPGMIWGNVLSLVMSISSVQTTSIYEGKTSAIPLWRQFGYLRTVMELILGRSRP